MIDAKDDPVVSEDNKSLTYAVKEGGKQEATTVGNSNLKFTLYWWGASVYFSHKAVELFKSKLYEYGAGVAGVNLAIHAVFTYFAVSPPGWLTALVSAVAAFGTWAFISSDKGHGVNISVFFVTGGFPVVTSAC
ncbi:hypothetical protein [Bacillus proteolyticus]|uniref:hypothetical protein n=1 Tax=Bacillus proteolyticus TaxID=2026192 RepID=UPI003D0667E9